MKIVIADASCLILFTNIRRLDLLKRLFGEVWITDAVRAEYGIELPPFISVHDPRDKGRIGALSLLLDLGESTSIALAVENPDCLIIIDEKKGRRIAKALGLNIVGTLGVLLEASEKGLISADERLVTELNENGFRLSARLKQRLLRKD